MVSRGHCGRAADRNRGTQLGYDRMINGVRANDLGGNSGVLM
jgi:hypothetical protein